MKENPKEIKKIVLEDHPVDWEYEYVVSED